MANKIVILADGDFPLKGGEAYKILTSAKYVVCCDGAADNYHRHLKRECDITIGDLDSVKKPAKKAIKITDQQANDLTKAIEYCLNAGYKSRDIVILGATGKREDHTIGNVYIAMSYHIEIVSDYGRFFYVEGRRNLTAEVDAGVSLFTLANKVQVRSRGLKWPLDGTYAWSPWSATLNRASAKRIMIETDMPLFVYVARNSY